MRCELEWWDINQLKWYIGELKWEISTEMRNINWNEKYQLKLWEIVNWNYEKCQLKLWEMSTEMMRQRSTETNRWRLNWKMRDVSTE